MTACVHHVCCNLSSMKTNYSGRYCCTTYSLRYFICYPKSYTLQWRWQNIFLFHWFTMFWLLLFSCLWRSIISSYRFDFWSWKIFLGNKTKQLLFFVGWNGRTGCYVGQNCQVNKKKTSNIKSRTWAEDVQTVPTSSNRQTYTNDLPCKRKARWQIVCVLKLFLCMASHTQYTSQIYRKKCLLSITNMFLAYIHFINLIWWDLQWWWWHTQTQ